MRMKMMVIRALSAAVLFLFLAQLNVWTDTSTHLVLAVGYRAFLLCAPIFLSFGLTKGMRHSLGICAVAMIAALFKLNGVTMALLAVGMAVSGYLAKYVATHTSQGAADNKVSLNIGSLVAGLLVMASTDRTMLTWICVGLVVIAYAISYRVDWDHVALSSSTSGDATKKQIRFFPILGWSLIGVATGIKLTGIFTILPQYLIAKSGALPSWFGMLIVVNSLLVIFAQHWVLRVLDRFPRFTFVTSLSAMLLLALPSVFRAEFFACSVAWVVLLTLGECALSRYDRVAKEAGYLFPKELMVGIGSFATVWLSRSFPELISLSGLLGAVCFVSGLFLIGINFRPFRRRDPVGCTGSMTEELHLQ